MSKTKLEEENILKNNKNESLTVHCRRPPSKPPENEVEEGGGREKGRGDEKGRCLGKVNRGKERRKLRWLPPPPSPLAAASTAAGESEQRRRRERAIEVGGWGSRRNIYIWKGGRACLVGEK